MRRPDPQWKKKTKNQRVKKMTTHMIKKKIDHESSPGTEKTKVYE